MTIVCEIKFFVYNLLRRKPKHVLSLLFVSFGILRPGQIFIGEKFFFGMDNVNGPKNSGMIFISCSKQVIQVNLEFMSELFTLRLLFCSVVGFMTRFLILNKFVLQQCTELLQNKPCL